MTASDFLPSGGQALAWLLGAVLTFGLLQVAAKALGALLAPIPVIGPFLSFAVQRFSGLYADWLAEKLPALADGAWKATEHAAEKAVKEQAKQAAASGGPATSTPPAAPIDKTAHAIEIVKAANPAAQPADVRRALDAAHLANVTAGNERPAADVFAAMLADMKGAQHVQR